MRLDLHCTLVSARWKSSLRNRPLVVLEFEAVGQPDLPPLLDLFAVDHPVGSRLLRFASEQLGVTIGDLGAQAERYVDELVRLRAHWRPVVLEVESTSWQGKDRLVVRRVKRPVAAWADPPVPEELRDVAPLLWENTRHRFEPSPRATRSCRWCEYGPDEVPHVQEEDGD